PRPHLLNLDAERMSFRLPEKLPRQVNELFEVAAGADVRIHIGIDRVDADAQPLERRREELRSHRLRQHQPVGRHTRLGEQPDRIVDAGVEQRLAHLVQPLQLQPEPVDLALRFLDERPGHVFVGTPQHRQGAHAAPQVALRGQLKADFDPSRNDAHRLTKRANTFAYSFHEYLRADSAAACSIAARSREVQNSSTARASPAGSSVSMSMPFLPSMISGSPPTRLAITGRAKWNAVSATPLCAS